MSGSVEHAEAKADRTEDRARAARVWSELTKAQRDFLYWCRYWTGKYDCIGCGASGSTVRAADALVARGLVTFEGFCGHFDDHSKPERATYAITEWGRIVESVDPMGRTWEDVTKERAETCARRRTGYPITPELTGQFRILFQECTVLCADGVRRLDRPFTASMAARSVIAEIAREEIDGSLSGYATISDMNGRLVLSRRGSAWLAEALVLQYAFSVRWLLELTLIHMTEGGLLGLTMLQRFERHSKDSRHAQWQEMCLAYEREYASKYHESPTQRWGIDP